ncbi:MAG TPA: hypothetical protein RWO09_05230 [Ruminococcus sp.]
MKKLFICAAAMLGLTAAFIPMSAFGADSSVASGWQTDEKGRIFYYGEDGAPAVGTVTIDGELYYFADNGVLKTGWRTVDGKRRYYDHKTGKPVYGWVDYCGKKYYISPDEGKLTGSIDAEDGGKILLGEYGYISEESGFTEVNGKFYYIGADGKLLVEPTEISGITYNFSEDGVLATGWQEVNGRRFYFSPETGKALLGKCKIGDNWYYISGIYGMATGDSKIGSVYYRFGDDGIIKTGWQTIEGEKHYYYEDTSVPKGITVIDGERYIFSNEGVMRTGRAVFDNKKYYLGTDGIIKTGAQDIDGKLFLFGDDGVMLTGWQELDGKKRYFDENNGMLTGRQIIDGFKYALDNNGIPLTGPVRFEDGDYLFGEDGKMLFGWHTVAGNKYYFEPSSGKMLKNRSIDGLWLNKNGVAEPLSDIQKKAEALIAKTGKTAAGIFNYVAANNVYKMIEATKTLAQIESIGWGHFAEYAMNNRYVVCYYFAALTDVMFQQAGFESRIVYGTGRGSGDHYWNQIKVNGVWTNYDTCNGYANVTDAFLASQNYTIKQYVTANFHD